MSTTYLCVICFLSRPFFSPHSRWSILFIAQDIVSLMLYNKIKEVVDLQIVHPNAAQPSGIFFPKFTDTKLAYTGGNSVKLVHYFSCVLLSVYFCFACQICAHAQFCRKTKANASFVYAIAISLRLLCPNALVCPGGVLVQSECPSK